MKYDAKIPKSQFLETGSYPIVSQEADFINGFWDKSSDLFKADGPVIVFGDHTKVLKYVNFEFVIGADGVKVLKPRPFLNAKYLYYFLRSVRLKRLGYARHYRLLTKISVNYPPLPEQKRIVAILDEAFEGIDTAVANTEKNLANARELFDSYLSFVFAQTGKGRVEMKLSDVCSIDSKLVDPRQVPFIDLPHLGAGNMISKTGQIVAIKTAREEGLISGKFLFDDNTVLYSKIRPYLMKACRPQFRGLCSADVYPLVVNSTRLNRDFLFHMLMSTSFTEYAVSGSNRSGMPKVNRDHLFRYSAWFPSVIEQARLAAKLDMISAEAIRLEGIYAQKLDSLTGLKQAILKKAFAGELPARSADPLTEAAQ